MGISCLSPCLYGMRGPPHSKDGPIRGEYFWTNESGALYLVENQPDQVYEREEDEADSQDGLADVQETPGDLTVPGSAELSYLNTGKVEQAQHNLCFSHLEGESEEESGGWDVGEDGLVEAGREVWVGRVPAPLEVPQWGGTE